MTENKITVFGTFWCSDCHRVKKFFDKNHIDYNWVDIDCDKNAQEFVLSTNHGMRSVPTILFADGSVMVEPSEVELSRLFGSISQS